MLSCCDEVMRRNAPPHRRVTSAGADVEGIGLCTRIEDDFGCDVDASSSIGIEVSEATFSGAGIAFKESAPACSWVFLYQQPLVSCKVLRVEGEER